jgi:membrane dipeptidase
LVLQIGFSGDMMVMTNTILFAAMLGASSLGAGGQGDAQRPKDPLTLDTHVDIPLAYMREARFDVGADTKLKVDLGKMERGGLDAAFFIVYVEQGPLTPEGYATAVGQAERKYSAIELMLKKYPQRIRLARTPDDVVANHAQGRLSAMIGIENAYSLGHDLKRLDAAYARGARYLGVVHVGNNDLCTSSLPNADLHEPKVSTVGLSEFGRAAVRRANELGIMVDVSHASDVCTRDVLAVSTAPVIASHSSSRALVDHPRNLSDDLAHAVAAKNGVIQVVAVEEFVKQDTGRLAAVKALQATVAKEAGAKEFDGETHEFLSSYERGMRAIDEKYPLATLDAYLDHIKHMVDVAGIDHVGIASDFDGGGSVAGWNNATETRNVTEGLRKRGFSEADIAKIWSGNLLRVWRSVEAAAKK